MASDDEVVDNRTRKVRGREKKRRHVQGSRAFTHAVTNRLAKEIDAKVDKVGEERRDAPNP